MKSVKEAIAAKYKQARNWYEVPHHKQFIHQSIGFTGDISNLLIQLRTKPRITDYVAIGFSGVRLVGNIKTAVEQMKRFSSIENDSLPHQSEYLHGYEQLFYMYEKPLLRLLEKVETVAFCNSKKRVSRGFVGGVEVRLVDSIHTEKAEELDKPVDPKNAYGYYCHESNMADLKLAIQKVMWEAYGTKQIALEHERPVPSTFKLDGSFFPTQFTRTLRTRVSKFMEAGHRRTYMLEGAPGMGKSQTVQSIIDEINDYTLRITPRSCEQDNEDIGVMTAVANFIELAQPRILVIDDLDYLPEGEQDAFLSFLETVPECVRVIMASINNADNVLPALLRPGRFDDHIIVPPLEEAAVSYFLRDTDPSLASRLVGWPIAYIVDFVTRAKVLGLEQAILEIDEIGLRAKEINAKATRDTGRHGLKTVGHAMKVEQPIETSAFGDLFKDHNGRTGVSVELLRQTEVLVSASKGKKAKDIL